MGFVTYPHKKTTTTKKKKKQQRGVSYQLEANDSY
jgi:hypothetical protein